MGEKKEGVRIFGGGDLLKEKLIPLPTKTVLSKGSCPLRNRRIAKNLAPKSVAGKVLLPSSLPPEKHSRRNRMGGGWGKNLPNRVICGRKQREALHFTFRKSELKKKDWGGVAHSES